MRDRAEQAEGNRSRHNKGKDEETKDKREQWRECLLSGCGGRGGGYDRDRVVEASGGLTGDCWLSHRCWRSPQGDILPEECIAAGRLMVASSYNSSSTFDKGIPRID